jgi:hypothetical protein
MNERVVRLPGNEKILTLDDGEAGDDIAGAVSAMVDVITVDGNDGAGVDVVAAIVMTFDDRLITQQVYV